MLPGKVPRKGGVSRLRNRVVYLIGTIGPKYMAADFVATMQATVWPAFFAVLHPFWHVDAEERHPLFDGERDVF